MTFCTVILHAKKVILRSGPILKVTYSDLGGHFVFCPLWNVFLYIAVEYRINDISLSLSNYHSIMLNIIIQVTTSNMAEKYKMVAK